jgi:hypothetical protein
MKEGGNVHKIAMMITLYKAMLSYSGCGLMDNGYLLSLFC